MASSDPSASPSGFSWEVTTKRSWPRRAASTGSMSVAALIFGVVAQVSGELVDQLGHAHATLDRVIVRERELRGPAQVELPGDPALEHAAPRARAPPASAPAAAPSRAR